MLTRDPSVQLNAGTDDTRVHEVEALSVFAQRAQYGRRIGRKDNPGNNSISPEKVRTPGCSAQTFTLRSGTDEYARKKERPAIDSRNRGRTTSSAAQILATACSKQ